jgi:hypothetical protein
MTRKRPSFTAKAKAFMRANASRPVVSATTRGPDTVYTLKGGSAYTLTPGECRAVNARWEGDE